MKGRSARLRTGKISALNFDNRLTSYQKKDWSFLEGKDGILVYTDKKGLNLSRSKQLSDSAAKANAEKIKAVLDNRASVVIAMGIFSLIVLIDVFVGSTPSKAIFGLKMGLFMGLIAVFGSMLAKARVSVDAPVSQMNESFEVKAVTSIMATPDEIS